jgi:hypothetical protein
MKNHLTKAGRETCGIADLKLDHFTDVKEALRAHLLKTDPIFRKASADGVLRNARRKESK